MTVPLLVAVAWRAVASAPMLDALQSWAARWPQPSQPLALQPTLVRALQTSLWRDVGGQRPQQLMLAVEQMRGMRSEPGEYWPILGQPPAARPHGRAHNRDSLLLLDALAVLTRRFLVQRGDHVALRPDTLDEFQRINKHVECNQLHTFSWASGAHTSRPWNPALGDDELLARARGPLMPPIADPLIEQLRQRGLADVHRHLNGSSCTLLLWLELLKRYPELARTQRRRRQILQPDASDDARTEYLAQQLRWLNIARHLRPRLLERVRPPATGTDKHEWRQAVLERLAPPRPGRYWSNSARRQSLDRRRLNSPARASVPACERQDAVGERALLYRIFRWLDRGDDVGPVERAAAHAYILTQNLVLSSLSQPVDGKVGLSRFVRDYSQADTREVSERDYEPRLVQAARTGGVRWLEARLSPSGSPRTKLKKLARARHKRAGTPERASDVPGDLPGHWLLEHWRARHRQQFVAEPMPQLGVVFHFIRQAPRQPDNDQPASLTAARHASLRARVWRQAQALVRALDDPEYGSLLVGLDIASEETAAGNEVFAPAIRFLRSYSSTGAPSLYPLRQRRPERTTRRSAPLRLTCHAGEDFDHLLGGMRAIDEALTFLEMAPGDRIGHGLAIGYEPAQWAQSCGFSVLHRVGPWLDDLVWFRHHLGRIADAHDVRDDVDTRIAELSAHVYGHIVPNRCIHSCTPASLHRAWTWRKEDPLAVPLSAHDNGKATGQLGQFVPSSGRSFAARSLRMRGFSQADGAAQLWSAYHFDRRVRQRSEEPIEVTIPPAWLPAMKRVQEQMLAHLTRRRIAIEINPSSNLSVGMLSDLSQHPVFRWLDPRIPTSDAPFLVVGSDDPGIFATELIHEYGFLARAAERCGATVHEIESWLERLRRTSVDFCFVNRDTAPAP